MDAFFNHSRRSQLGVVILADEDHDSYGICFVEKRFQVGPLEIGIEPGRDEIFWEKLHGLLGNHEAYGVSGKLCMSQNNHTVSILTGCAGDGKPLKIIGKPLKKAESR